MGKSETQVKWKKSKDSKSVNNNKVFTRDVWHSRRAEENSETDDGDDSSSDENSTQLAKSLSSCVLWQPKSKQLSYYSENILDKCRRIHSRNSSRSRFSDRDDDEDSDGEHYEDLYSFYDVPRDSDDDFSLPDIDLPLEVSPAKETKRKRRRKATKNVEDATRKSRKGKRTSESLPFTRNNSLTFDQAISVSTPHVNSSVEKRARKSSKSSKKSEKENKRDEENSDPETGLLLSTMFGKRKRKEKASSPVDKKRKKDKEFRNRSKKRKKGSGYAGYERLTPSPFPEIDPDMPVLERMDEVEDTSHYVRREPGLPGPAQIYHRKESSGDSTILIDSLPPNIAPITDANIQESSVEHQVLKKSPVSEKSSKKVKKKSKKKKRHRGDKERRSEVFPSTSSYGDLDSESHIQHVETQSTGIQCTISIPASNKRYERPEVNNVDILQEEPQQPSVSRAYHSAQGHSVLTSQSEEEYDEVQEPNKQIELQSYQQKQKEKAVHRKRFEASNSTDDDFCELPVNGKYSCHMPAFGSPSSGDGDDPFSFEQPMEGPSGCGYNCGGCADCDNTAVYHSSPESEYFLGNRESYCTPPAPATVSSPTPSTSFTCMPPPTRRPPRTPKKNVENVFSNSNPTPCSSGSTVSTNSFPIKSYRDLSSNNSSSVNSASTVETDLGAIPTYQLLTNPKLFRIGIGLVKQLASRKMTAEQVKRRLGYMDLDEGSQSTTHEELVENQRRAERELSPDIVMLTVPERMVKEEEEAYICKEEEEISEALATPVTLDCDPGGWRKESSGDVTDEGADLDSASECDILELGSDGLKELFCRLDHHERPHASHSEYQPRGIMI